MEDVLKVYSRVPRQDRPLVCLDEFAKQLLFETRPPVAAIPGHLARTCLDRKIGPVGEFTDKVKAYLARKNGASKPIRWQFTNKKARVKLKSLYPTI